MVIRTYHKHRLCVKVRLPTEYMPLCLKAFDPILCLLIWVFIALFDLFCFTWNVFKPSKVTLCLQGQMDTQTIGCVIFDEIVIIKTLQLVQTRQKMDKITCTSVIPTLNCTRMLTSSKFKEKLTRFYSLQFRCCQVFLSWYRKIRPYSLVVNLKKCISITQNLVCHDLTMQLSREDLVVGKELGIRNWVFNF